MLSFGKSSQKSLVGVAITPNIGVEMVLIDKKTSLVQKYAQRPLDYNSQKREIEDYSALKSAIIDLCTELNISIKAEFYLVLPSILFSFIDLPSSIQSEEIDSILTAKVEESYIFRKAEPTISHAVARMNTASESKYLVYSAIQKEIVEKLKDVFSEMGGELVGIENANTAILRGVEFLHFADDVIKSNESWNVLLVSSNNYTLFALTGNSVHDCVEVPLAIKSLSIEEAYQAISGSVSQNLPNYPAKKLIIVSQTDDISAEVLKTQVNFDQAIETLECNRYAKSSRLMTVSDISENDIMGISLSAIGSGTTQSSKMTSTLNFLAKPLNLAGSKVVTIFGKTVVLTTESLNGLVLLLAGVIFALFLGLYFGIKAIGDSYTSSSAAKETQLQQVQAEISAIKGDGPVRIEDLIAKIVSNNKKAISYYDSLSTEIPKNVWLTYAYLRDGENISIEGLSIGINDIYEYYKGLKNSTPASTIQLKKLKIITDIATGGYDPASDELKLYDFEISNTTSKKNGGGIVAPTTPAPGADGAPAPAPGDTPAGDTPPPPPSGGAPQLPPVDINN